MKQRLVGAAVIVALAVVIIPMLLNGSGDHGVRKIPPAPQAPAAAGQGGAHEQSIPLPPGESEAAASDESAPAAPTPKPDQSVAPPPTPATAAAAPQSQAAVAEPSAPAAPAATPEPKAAAPAAATQPKSTEASSVPAAVQVPKALTSWVIQVGSFSEQSKAIALRDRLRNAKFPAFVERFVGADKRPMYRVRVGPELDRAKAEAMQKRLQEQQHLKGFVTEHS